MPKILTVTPKEGESEAAFATRFERSCSGVHRTSFICRGA